MNDYVRSLLRFWWVIVIGLAVAVAAGILAVYNVDFSSSPPSLTERTKPSYSAQGRLLVTDSTEPHLRISITTLQAVAADADGTPRLLPVTSAPDTATLVQAANLYPSYIESDQVAAISREDLRPERRPAEGAGALRDLEREPVRAVARPRDPADRRRRHAEESDRPRHADEHGVHTVADAEPARAGIKPKQRITVVALQTPEVGRRSSAVRRRRSPCSSSASS